MMINKNIKIYIAGHNGMVGSACWKVLKDAGYKNLIGKTSKELDLRNQSAVINFLSKEKPYAIIDAAANVGGILANNTYPYEFLMNNMLIQNNLIKSAHDLDIPKFIFLGSSCIYPKLAPQPLKEEYLLTGPLEATNEWYAIAKISGVKLIEALRTQYGRDYVSLMPTNLYGPRDNFNPQNSHVIPGIIYKIHKAILNNENEVKLWGSGDPYREFLHVEDLARGILFVFENDLNQDLINIGSGEEIQIKELAELIKKITRYSGKIVWDTSKPDGTPKKLLDISKITNHGWTAKIELEQGLKNTYSWFKELQKIHPPELLHKENKYLL